MQAAPRLEHRCLDQPHALQRASPASHSAPPPCIPQVFKIDDIKRKKLAAAIEEDLTINAVLKFIRILSLAFSGVGSAFVPQAILSEVLVVFKDPIGEYVKKELAWFVAKAGQKVFHWNQDTYTKRKDAFMEMCSVGLCVWGGGGGGEGLNFRKSSPCPEANPDKQNIYSRTR